MDTFNEIYNKIFYGADIEFIYDKVYYLLNSGWQTIDNLQTHGINLYKLYEIDPDIEEANDLYNPLNLNFVTEETDEDMEVFSSHSEMSHENLERFMNACIFNNKSFYDIFNNIRFLHS